MIRCLSCFSDAPDGSRFCPACGGALPPSSVTPTRTAMRDGGSARVPGPAPPSSPSAPLDRGRFLPGANLAGRYRIVGLLGWGGMGEVYRADDLKLGQTVALKFLPADVRHDPERLARLVGEVRVARQISHPNVCRVYDIGEVDGHHFLSMEFVDGEDLASLLRRIGRLPRDKAVQIARELCAGLAAAHEQSILHRDLKPANVMIDGRGRARITDFGLAALAESVRGAEAHAGTPGYMSPEQVAGESVSVRSDIYALGLVLYELFTGRPAFKASTPAEFFRLQRETTPTTPSSLVDGFDPAVERVIVRCLEKDPRRRPSSALMVAAGLPGGDPLAAALAAGETPSPEMVADAGESGGLPPGVAWAGLAGILVGVVVLILGAGQAMMVRRLPFEKPPDALADRAREIVEKLGYTEPPTDRAYGFDLDADYVRYVEVNDQSPARWDGLRTGRPAAVYFWYRQSPRYLVQTQFSGPAALSLADPPEVLSGMAHVTLDLRGRLSEFVAVPPQQDDSKGPWPAPDWSAPFTEAGLDVAKFTATEATWTPSVYADVRAAWEGALPENTSIPIRVEAAAYHGRPVSFQILGRWSRPGRMQPFQRALLARVSDIVGPAVVLSALAGGFLLARRNLRLGRGDRRGAFRLAIYVFSVMTLIWVLGANHVPTLDGEAYLFFLNLAFSLLGCGGLWLIYIAMEPHVRRQWPEMIISWSRLLAGRVRDPLVGRDILLGGLCGIAWALSDSLYHLLPAWLGLPPQAPHPIAPGMLLGVRHFLSGMLAEHFFSLSLALLQCFLLVLLRIILRRQWLAAAAFFLIFTFSSATGAGNPYINLSYAAFGAALIGFTLIRLGLLAAITARCVTSLLIDYPLTFDFSAWYAGLSLFGISLILGLAVYGFYQSQAGRPLFRAELLES